LMTFGDMADEALKQAATRRRIDDL
jgi:hypothetical protein